MSVVVPLKLDKKKFNDLGYLLLATLHVHKSIFSICPSCLLLRFTKAYLDPLLMEDMSMIIENIFPGISKPLADKLISFNDQLQKDIIINQLYGQSGQPWEFNLRDVIRVCNLLLRNQNELISQIIDMEVKGNVDFLPTALEMIYVDRMRTPEDKKAVNFVFLFVHLV